MKFGLISSRKFRFLIVLLGIILSTALALFIDQLERNRAVDVFENHADNTYQALLNRIDGHNRTLDGTAALFAASETITSLDWKHYVDTLEIEENMPAILGVGYITLVREVEGISIADQMLERGYSLPRVYPDTGLPERFIVQFVEPLADNRSALGLDMGFEPERRRSAQVARDTNTVQLTPPIELVQNNGRELGFLLLRPHYRPRADLSSPQAMSEAFEGWLYLPFIGKVLFSSLTSQQENIASLSVLDQNAGGEAVTVFSDVETVASDNPRFVTTRQVNIFGRDWTLTWHSSPAFEQANRGLAKWIVFALGIIIFSLINLISKVLEKREQRIEMDVERKTIEIRAKTEETLSVIENAVIAILVLDENARVVSANHAALHLFEAGRVKVGTCIHDVIVFESTADKNEMAAKRARCPSLPSLRLKVQRNEWSTANGAARSTLLVQDVSESEAGARKLQANEARWNLAMEGAQIGVFDINLKTNKSVVSDTWRELMRIPLDATALDTQNQFMSRIHPDDLQILQAADKACIDGKTKRSIAEYRMRFEDGTVRWMKSDAVVVARDDEGNALRLIGAQTDQTDLREIQDALKASRERFELVLEQAPVGMALFNHDGQFLGMNEALCRMTGYGENEMREGLRFRNLFSRSDFYELIDKISELKSENQSSYQNEYLITPKNGPPIWGLLSIAWAFEPTEDGEVFIFQINDISEKKNIEKMKSEFVATVSHELRTPLTSIKGALGLMRGPMLQEMPAGADRLLEIASGNTDRLSALVNDILDLEKIRSGEIEFQIEPIDLRDLLLEGVEQMLPFAVQHKVEFQLEAPDHSIFAMIDPQRTQQLVANLLSNACKYSDPDTKVHIRLEVVGKNALVCVLNDGPVITDEFKTKIFRPFTQADSSDTRAKGGTGLGLNISRQIVERMAGKIGFKSDTGEPTAFWFTVPLAPSSSPVQPSEIQPQTPQPIFTVLHLEDDSDFSEIVRSGLGSLANMKSVPTVAAARDALQKHSFDLIVIDWELPDGHGRDLLDEIVRFQPHARIISLSASETTVRDLRVDLEIVKSRSDLSDIVSKMVEYSRSA